MQDQLDLAPAEEREILNQIRNDHELVARLKITPQELETLSKCALLGTLTSKHDMLFILRQIREATGTAIDGATVIAQPPPIEEEAPEEPTPDLIRVAVRATPAVMHDAGLAPGHHPSPRAGAVRHTFLDAGFGGGSRVECRDPDDAMA